MASIIFGGALVLALILPLVLGLLARGAIRVGWSDHLGTTETFLTVIGILIAAGWYFIQRPNDAKVKLEQAISAYPTHKAEALVISEISLTNLGSTVLNLKSGKIHIYVQQITPIVPDVAATLRRSANRDDQPISPGDTWARLASLSDGDAGSSVNSTLEAGETENLYFRTLLPCQRDLRVYVTTRFRRPASPLIPELAWIKQTPLDLTSICNEQTP